MFVTEPSGMMNIEREGLTGKAYLVGNVMIDSLVAQLDRARRLKVHERFGLEPQRYVVSTFHRPSNVDDANSLRAVVEIIKHTCDRLPMVLPLHPRTRQALERFELLACLERIESLHLSEPLGYLEFVSLVSSAAAVITDSGGIQEETTYLRVPCITMRENTERPITVEVGSNVLAGTLPDMVKSHIDSALASGTTRSAIPDLWEGRAAMRIVAHLREELSGMKQQERISTTARWTFSSSFIWRNAMRWECGGIGGSRLRSRGDCRLCPGSSYICCPTVMRRPHKYSSIQTLFCVLC